MNMRMSIGAAIFPIILIGPWVNILVRHGYLDLIVVAFGLSVLLLLLWSVAIVHRRSFVDKVGLLLLSAIVLCFVSSVIYHVFNIGFIAQEGGYLTFSRFYGTLVLLLLFWLVAQVVGSRLEHRVYWFSLYFFVVGFLNIAWGGVVEILELPRSWELMQHADYSDGVGRPFGLTGNAAVNSTMLVVSYLIMVRSKAKENISLHWKWFFLLCLGVVIQQSGSGMGALLIAVIYHLREVPLRVKLMVLAVIPIVAIFGTMYELEAFRRISPDYILHIYTWLHKNVMIYLNFDLSLLDLLLGKAVPLGARVLTTDFGALYIINQMGLLFFSFLTLLLLRVAFRSGMPVDRYIVFIVFLTGIHYQAIFFLSSAVIFSMYIIVVLADKNLNYSLVQTNDKVDVLDD
jgi:hypothetical protein